MSPAGPPREEGSHERRVLLLALLPSLPAVALAVGLLWTQGWIGRWRWVLGAAVALAWLWGAFSLRTRVARTLQNLANLVGALREGDFSFRGRRLEPRDALGEALAEINGLADSLAAQRTGAVEATALLEKVMAEIDVAVFAFGERRELRLVNPAGERLLGSARPALVGREAVNLGMAALLEGPTPRTVEVGFPGGQGQWELRRNTFRQSGRPHELVVLTDLRRALREEERQAWQRLVRVLGHEINNSLGPIRGIAGDMKQLLERPPDERPADWSEDLGRGLGIIERRSAALDRFMTGYARLAKLPPPVLAPLVLTTWLPRVIDLDPRLLVRLRPGPEASVPGDSDQLEQVLINLLRNAALAARETGGEVEVTWRVLPGRVEILIVDEGPGLLGTENLFVPFFTTKPGGSGIGLVLGRQIAEAHGGTLTLTPRADRTGAVACLRLPV